MKNIGIGLLIMILVGWTGVAVITVLGLLINIGNPGMNYGFTFEWFTWILIAPLLAIALALILLIAWGIGSELEDKVK